MWPNRLKPAIFHSVTKKHFILFDCDHRIVLFSRLLVLALYYYMYDYVLVHINLKGMNGANDLSNVQRCISYNRYDKLPLKYSVS